MTKLFRPSAPWLLASTALGMVRDPLAGEFIALEPRMVFDGSGAALATEAAKHVDSAPAPSAEPTKQSEPSHDDTGTKPAVPEHPPAAPAPAPHSVLFIDARVPAIDTFRQQAGADTPVVVVQANEDGLGVISRALAGLKNIEAVHIVSHGREGAFELGNAWIDDAAVTSRRDELSHWRDALTEQADILLYGCDVGAGDDGAKLMADFAAETGADVAASADDVGLTDHGPDWTLERTTGTIEARTLAPPGFDAKLAPPPSIGLVTLIDDVAPKTTPITLARGLGVTDGNWTNDHAPAFSGSGAVAGATIKLYILENGKYVQRGQTTADSKGSYTNLQFTGTLTEQSGKRVRYTFAVTQTVNGEESAIDDLSNVNVNFVTTPPPSFTSANKVFFEAVSSVDQTIPYQDGTLIPMFSQNFHIKITLTKAQYDSLSLGYSLSGGNYVSGGYIYFYARALDANGDPTGNWIAVGGSMNRFPLQFDSKTQTYSFVTVPFNSLLGILKPDNYTTVDLKYAFYGALVDQAGNGLPSAPTDPNVSLLFKASYQRPAAPTILGVYDDVDSSGNATQPESIPNSGTTNDTTPTFSLKIADEYIAPDGSLRYPYVAFADNFTPTGSTTTLNYGLRLLGVDPKTGVLSPGLSAWTWDPTSKTLKVTLDLATFTSRPTNVDPHTVDGTHLITIRMYDPQMINPLNGAMLFAVDQSFTFKVNTTYPTFRFSDAVGPVQIDNIQDWSHQHNNAAALVDAITIRSSSLRPAGSTLTIKVNLPSWPSPKSYKVTVGTDGTWDLSLSGDVLGYGLIQNLTVTATDDATQAVTQGTLSQVYLTGAWTPGGLGLSGLAAWFDTSIAGAFTGSGSSGFTLLDLSGNGLDAKSAGTLAPMLVTNAYGQQVLSLVGAVGTGIPEGTWDGLSGSWLQMPSAISPVSLVYAGQLAQSVSGTYVVDAARTVPFGNGFGFFGFYAANGLNTIGFGATIARNTGGAPIFMTGGNDSTATFPWTFGSVSLGPNGVAMTINGALDVLKTSDYSPTNVAVISQIGGRFTGQLGLMVAYNRALSAAETALLANAEQQRFGTPLSANGTTAQDLFVVRGGSDNANQMQYSNDIGGILQKGADIVSNSGNGGLIIADNSFLTDGASILFGNNGGSGEFKQDVGGPTPGFTHYAREWAIDVTGGNDGLNGKAAGTVDLSFDVASLEATVGGSWQDVLNTFQGRSNLKLAWKANETDAWQYLATTDSNVELDGGKIVFKNVRVGDNGLRDGFITLLDGPVITGITASTADGRGLTPTDPPSNDPNVTYRVYFSEETTGLTTSSFKFGYTAAKGFERVSITSVDGTTSVDENGKYYVDVKVNVGAGQGGIFLRYDYSQKTGVDTGTQNAGNAVVGSDIESNPVYLYFETQPPQPTFRFSDSTLTTAADGTTVQTSQATITFDEATYGFTAADLSIVDAGGNAVDPSKVWISDFAGTDGGTTFTFTLHADAGIPRGRYSVRLAADYHDEHGNTPSAPVDSPAFTVDTARPTVTSILRAGGAPETSTDDSVGYLVTFSETVTGVDTNDFVLLLGGKFADSSTLSWTVTRNDAGGRVWVVTASDKTGSTTLASFSGVASLTFAPGAKIRDPDGATVADIKRAAWTTGSDTATFTVTFSGTPTGVEKSDFTSSVGTVDSITKVNDYTWTVTVKGAAVTAADGQVTLSFTGVSDGTATGNAFDPTLPVGDDYQTYTLDHELSFTGYVDGQAPQTTPAGSTTGFDTPTNDVRPTIVGVAMNGAEVTLTVDGTAVARNDVRYGDANSAGTGKRTWSYTPTADLAEGPHKLKASTPGLTSEATLTVDTVAPTVTVSISNPVVNAIETATVTFSFSEEPVGFDLSKVTSPDGTLSNLQAKGQQNGRWIYTGTFTPNPGTQSKATWVSIAAGAYADAAGNAGAAGQVAVTVDTVPPTVSLTNPGLINTGTPTLTGTAEAGATVAVLEKAPGGGVTLLGTVTADGSGTWSFTIPAGSKLADGSHTLQAETTDAAGNAATADATFTVDTTPPDVGITTAPSLTNKPKPDFAGTAEAGATVELFVKTAVGGTTSLGTTTADPSGHWSLTATSPLAEGTNAVFARATDAAGNSKDTSEATVTVDTIAPTATLSASPSSVAADGSATIIVVISEKPVGLSLADFAVSGGSLSNLVADGPQADGTSRYTATFTPAASAEGPIVASVVLRAGSYTDAAGNAGGGGQVRLTVARAPDAPFTTHSAPGSSPPDAEAWPVLAAFAPREIAPSSPFIVGQDVDGVHSSLSSAGILVLGGTRAVEVYTFGIGGLSGPGATGAVEAAGIVDRVEIAASLSTGFVSVEMRVKDSGGSFSNLAADNPLVERVIIEELDRPDDVLVPGDGRFFVSRHGPSLVRVLVDVKLKSGLTLRQVVTVDVLSGRLSFAAPSAALPRTEPFDRLVARELRGGIAVDHVRSLCRAFASQTM